MSSQIKHTHSHQDNPKAPILDTWALIFSRCALFVVYPNCIMWRHPSPLHVITTRAWEGGSKENSAKQKLPRETHSVTYVCTRASFVHCHATSTVIPLLPKATFTLSIQPNLCLPRTRPPLTSPSTPFWPYGIHPFFPHAQTISMLSDMLYSLTPFLIQLPYAPLHS